MLNFNAMKRDFIRIAYFHDDRMAALFQAQLEDAGVPSFVSNAHANSLLPHLGGGVGIHIHKENMELSNEILKKFQELHATDQSVFTHHEATHADIEYEKERNTNSNSFNKFSIVAGILLFLVLLRYLAKSQGMLPQFFDPF